MSLCVLGSRFLNVPPPASGVKGNGEVKNGLIRGEEENDSDDEDGTTSSSESVRIFSHCHTCLTVCASEWRGHRRRRRGKGVWDWGPRKKAKREAEDEEEDVEKEPAPNPFITARDQHVNAYVCCTVSTMYAVGIEPAEEVWREQSATGRG